MTNGTVPHSAFAIHTSFGAVGVLAGLGELGDEGLLSLGQLRWLGSEDLMAKTWVAEICVPFFATDLFARRMGELRLPVLGQHAFDVMRGWVEAGLDDRLDAPLAENPGDSFRETFESGGGAGNEDAGLAGHAESVQTSGIEGKECLRKI